MRKGRRLAASESELAKALKKLLDKGRGHIIDYDLDVTADSLENRLEREVKPYVAATKL